MAPGSWWPMDRSPRYEARPLVASIGVVASMPCSAAATASRAASSGASAPPRAASSDSTAGAIVSTIVFSPRWALPRCTMPSSAARAARTTSSKPASVRPARTPPARRKAVPYSGPAAPPTVDTSVLPTIFRMAPRSSSCRSASLAATAEKPRSRLVPWSASPIGESSSVR